MLHEEATRIREICWDKDGEKEQEGSEEESKKIVLKASIATKLPASATKAEPGTLPHDLPYSSYSRRQRYQVSALLLLISPP